MVKKARRRPIGGDHGISIELMALLFAASSFVGEFFKTLGGRAAKAIRFRRRKSAKHASKAKREVTGAGDQGEP